MNKLQYIFAPTKEYPYAVINKPAGLPSAPLDIDDKQNALSLFLIDFPNAKKVCGKKEIEHGLIHRLDTVTEGLMLIACTQNAYDYFVEQQEQNKIIKTYTAICNLDKENSKILSGFPDSQNFLIKENSSFKVESFFRSFGPKGKQVRPVTKNCSQKILKKIGKPKLYTTTIKICKILDDNTAKVECTISQGYRHQVRCHLAWVGLPIVGDTLYNNNASDEAIKFYATKLDFSFPKDSRQTYELTKMS